MALLAIVGVALAGLLQEAVITGGLPELHMGLEGLFLTSLALLVVAGWALGDARGLAVGVVPVLGALAYLIASDQSSLLDDRAGVAAELAPLYLAAAGAGVLVCRLVPRQQGGSRVGGLR